jgi:hypothetical protein
VILLQHGFGVEQVNLRGRARHKQEDNPLRAGLEMRWLGREGVVIARGEQFRLHQRVQRKGTDAVAAHLEKIAARHL